MKIAVYGATGQAGSRIVAEAARRGHTITALSRRQPSAAVPAGASWQAGDATDIDSVAEIAADHDAVVAAHGPSREAGGDPQAFIGEFAAFAEAVAGTRLAVIGGAGSLYAAPGIRLVDTAEFPEVHKAEALAHAAVLDELLASDQPSWTYLSPAPVLEPGERTGEYLLSDETPAGMTITFEDLAVVLVDELENPVHVNARFTAAAR
jgi:putative NADH-flavin reductase